MSKVEFRFWSKLFGEQRNSSQLVILHDVFYFYKGIKYSLNNAIYTATKQQWLAVPLLQVLNDLLEFSPFILILKLYHSRKVLQINFLCFQNQKKLKVASVYFKWSWPRPMSNNIGKMGVYYINGKIYHTKKSIYLMLLL